MSENFPYQVRRRGHKLPPYSSYVKRAISRCPVGILSLPTVALIAITLAMLNSWLVCYIIAAITSLFAAMVWQLEVGDYYTRDKMVSRSKAEPIIQTSCPVEYDKAHGSIPESTVCNCPECRARGGEIISDVHLTGLSEEDLAFIRLTFPSAKIVDVLKG